MSEFTQIYTKITFTITQNFVTHIDEQRTFFLFFWGGEGDLKM